MSKSLEEFKQLMESDRGERAYYENASPTDTVKMPITRDGVEAVLARACAHMNLPVTNPLRNVLVGFLHHIEKTVCTFTIEAAGAAFHNSMSNQCTWEIDQEIKKAANAEMEILRQAQRDAAAAAEKERKIQAAQQKRSAKGTKKPIVKTTLTAEAPSTNEKAQ